MSARQAPDIELADLAKTGRERIKIAVREFKGSRNVDVRIHAVNTSAELVPTKQGVSIRPTLLRDVIDALLRAEALLVADGALPEAGRSP